MTSKYIAALDFLRKGTSQDTESRENSKEQEKKEHELNARKQIISLSRLRTRAAQVRDLRDTLWPRAA
eukprot:CAMPEP_0182810440 /NCGR_PEP_ID=MMETSP0006_2-20121128/7736_1 /TAXON_ID=97485 /ORGANISM="Prymnesium parvum, Strain Texoma1" /LENGTH=67 /DNA_ID=CAMNT_0024936327 /DNA_START=42 /DNA_END=245 /DNA_ORIENTATION=-